MNTGGEQGQQTERAGRAGSTGEQVVLVYRPTLADIQGAVRARARRTAVGRRETLLLLLVGGVLVVGYGVVSDSSPVVIAFSTAVSLGVGLAVLAWARRGTARQVYDLVGRYGECRTVVDDRGTATSGGTMSATTHWTLFQQYVETRELFVLIGGAAVVEALPKRGAEHPEDIDRLRAILDRNLRRI